MRAMVMFCALLASQAALCADGDSDGAFHAFTGKVTKDKVRLRLQPTLDCPVIRSLREGDLLVIVGETEDFYAVQPPTDVKGYVYRTLVLDNVVEGNHVNVRLEPQLEAPVIAQLNAGERVNGRVAPANSKWLEIEPPAEARFFISRDYIENIGDADFIATFRRKRAAAEEVLTQAEKNCEIELQKPFEAMQLSALTAALQRIADEYRDIPDLAARAERDLKVLQESYLERKIAYLEEQRSKSELWQKNALRLRDTVSQQQQRLQQLEEQRQTTTVAAAAVPPADAPLPAPLPTKMAAWLPAEEAHYAQWCRRHGNGSRGAYEAEQRNEAVTLEGIVEAYTRPIKNKPGDYLLVNAHRQPIAYLYSTAVNLQECVGHHVTLRATVRPNQGFAFPAYAVLAID